MGGAKGRGQILVWTDLDLWSLQFVGDPFYFALQQLGTGCGLYSPFGYAVVDRMAFWIGTNNFYVYDGDVQVLDCPVHAHVFDNIVRTQPWKVKAGVNKRFHEIWWFYPGESDENDHYVVYNYKENHWTIGTMDRTCWLPEGTFQFPIAINSTGTVFFHEVGSDANGSAMEAFVETGYFDWAEGDTMLFMDRVIPDIMDVTGTESVQFYVYSKRYPNADPITKGPYSVFDDTEKVSLRARGRSFKFRFESSDIGNGWRMGKWRADMQPDGKR